MLRFRGPALNRDLNRRLVLEELEPRTLLAVSIQFDYSLDDQGFFNSQTRRTLLQSVADSISDHFTDTLDAVGTRTWTISDPANFTNTVSVTRSVPADTIVVYVGGSNLSGNTVGQGGSTWLTNHRGEGNGSTDFGPALGYLTFDNDGSTTWNFDPDPGPTGTAFIAVAAHELLHALGIGVAPSWYNLIANGTFTGPNTTEANGGIAPAVTAGGDHFDQSVNTIMTPVVSRTTLSNLDFSALDDIGWSLDAGGGGDGNDTLATAETNVTTFSGQGASGSGAHAIAPGDDVDLFRVEMFRGTTFTFSTFSDGSDTVDTYLRLFDANGVEIPSSQLGPDYDDRDGTNDRYSTLRYTASTSGVFYVGVSSSQARAYDPTVDGSSSGSDTGDYRYSLSYEANDTGGRISTAVPTGLTTSNPFETNTVLQHVGDEDLFALTATAGDTLTVQTSYPSDGTYEVDTYLRLFAATGQELLATGTGGAGNYAAFQYTFSASGTYYVGVSTEGNRDYDPNGAEPESNLAGPDGGDYNLRLTLEPDPDFDEGFPGDSFPDLVSRTSSGQWWISQNNGSLVDFASFGVWNEAAGWRDVATGDFNHDGLSDVVGRTSGGQWWVGVNTGDRFQFSLFGAWAEAANWRDVHVLDVNGDGRSDVVGRTAGGQWWAGLSNGTSFSNRYLGSWSATAGWRDVLPVDFNNDGRDDILGRTSGGQWWGALSTGTSFSNQYLGSWSESADWRDVQTGDFDADGRVDVIGRTSGGQWWVGANRGSSLQNLPFGNWAESAGWRDVLVGDFAGDNRVDVIGRTSGGQWWVGVNTPTGLQNALLGAWSPALDWLDVTAGNLAGTGKADLIGRTPDGIWWIAENTTSGLRNRVFGQWANLPWRFVGEGNFFGGEGNGALHEAHGAEVASFLPAIIPISQSRESEPRLVSPSAVPPLTLTTAFQAEEEELLDRVQLTSVLSSLSSSPVAPVDSGEGGQPHEEDKLFEELEDKKEHLTSIFTRIEEKQQTRTEEIAEEDPVAGDREVEALDALFHRLAWLP
jgi:hypothetical protein